MSLVRHHAVCQECVQFMVKLSKHTNSKVPPSVGELLKTLHSQMEMLLQAWSVMAGRNIIASMMRTVQAMELGLEGEARVVTREWRQRLGVHLGRHNIANARYDSALCLGYKVRTSGDQYNGQADDYDDLRDKCQEMIKAIQAAHALISMKERSNGQMLKIFMAPEFFFRGINGGYDYDDVLGLQAHRTGVQKPGREGLLDMMRAEIGRPIYKDWLFVLGTVVAISQKRRHRCYICTAGAEGQIRDGVETGVCKGDPTHPVGSSDVALVDNFAYVCKESEVHTVTKELVSGLDYEMHPGIENVVRLRGVGLDVERRPLQAGGWAAGDRPSKFQDERMGGCIFTMDGVTFGLEICLDHTDSDNSAPVGRLNHAANIQIQLIPAAGVQIEQFRTVAGGIVFNVDGLNLHVQAVGKRGASIEGYETNEHTDQKFKTDNWVPEELTLMMDRDDWRHDTDYGYWRPGNSRIANAPRGVVVCFGPFEIPQV